MAKFGKSSKKRLATCDERLQKVFNEVIKYVDCSVLEGHRSEERQTLFAGFVLGLARGMGINLRWGGDWDQDFEVMDNRFDDFPHFEVRD